MNHSATFEVFHQAILAKQQVTCMYGGHFREICPYILGHTAGQEVALVYQFGGTSTRGLPARGAWRCFYLEGIQDVASREGPWHGATAHRTSQRCVEQVFIDVNTDVPNQPGRQGVR